MDILTVKPFSKYCSASVLPVGSKSITNRALILAAVHGCGCEISGALFSRDTEIMMDCLRALGLEISADKTAKKITVGAGKMSAKRAKLFVGNAGTAARFVSALAATVEGGEFYFDSDVAMYARPMKGLLEVLAAQGARFEFGGRENSFPFKMYTNGLKGGRAEVDASKSSQILSALMMVAPLARERLELVSSAGTVSAPFVEMTRKMAAQFPCARYEVEPDATAASYFAALPMVVGGVCALKNFAKIKLQGDARFVEMLEGAGLVRTRVCGNDLLVCGADEFDNSDLTLDFNDISDTFLTLAAAAAYLPRRVRITGIAHTRGQETDRVAAMASQLKKVAAEVVEGDGYLEIVSHPALAKCRTRSEIRRVLGEKLSGKTVIKTFDDHRIAMSFAVLGCADISRGAWLEIENPECVAKTWREFFPTLDAVRVSSEKFRVVAVDGGAAVGKSSVSKAASAALGYMHVDTGAHYRNIAYILLEGGLSPEDPDGVAAALQTLSLSTAIDGNDAKILCGDRVLTDADIRSERVNANVSHFASIVAVRDFLKSYQRSMAGFAANAGFGGLIMEGRDIGSVIFPDADAAIFLDADEQTRSLRRAKEGITDSIAKRDALDRRRKVAPLVRPEGSVLIDTSHMTKDEVVAQAISVIINS